MAEKKLDEKERTQHTDDNGPEKLPEESKQSEGTVKEYYKTNCNGACQFLSKTVQQNMIDYLLKTT